MAYLTVIHPPSRRGAAAGLAMNGVALGVVVGPLVGGGLYSLAGRVGPFYPVLALLAVSAFAQVGLAFGERRIGEVAGMGRYMLERGAHTEVCCCAGLRSYKLESKKSGQQCRVFTDSYVLSLASTPPHQHAHCDEGDSLPCVLAVCVMASNAGQGMIEPVVPRFLHLQYVPRLLCVM